MVDQKRIPVLLTEEQHEALRKLSYETRESMSEIIRKAIDAYLKNQGKGK